MKSWPLKTRLVLWTMLVGGLSVAVFSAIAGRTLQLRLEKQLDTALRSEAESVLDGISQIGRPVNWDNQREIAKLFTSVISLYSFEIEQPPGTLVYRSRALGNTPFPPCPEGVPITGAIGDDDSARILQLTRNPIRIRVAVDAIPLLRWEKNLWWMFAIILPLSVVLLGYGANRLYTKALKPVDSIVAAAERISAERLDERLPMAESLDEIGHLTAVLNRMIERLQRSFEQARRFSSDASHELKTPLTIIRGELEIALHSGEITPAAERTMLDVLEETGRLIHIVEGLLLLSQADAGKLPITREPVDLTAIIEDLADDIEILAARHDIAVDFRLAPATRVSGSPQFLRQLVLSLLDNAIKYNRPNGDIRCTLSSSERMATFRIANTGHEIPEADRERVFTRFYRLEASRTRGSAGGQGLGLSIAREIAHAHGGRLTIEPSESGWTVFQFILPLCEDAGAKRPQFPAQAGV